MSILTFGKRHIVRGLDAVADAFAGTVTSDAVKMAEYAVAEFLIHKGVGAAGTSTITVEACDNAAGDNPVAVPFRVQKYLGATGTDDLPGAVTDVAAAGFATTAGSSQLYSVQVDSQSLGAKGWCRLKAVEVVNDPVLGGIMIVLHGPRYATDIPNTAIA